MTFPKIYAIQKLHCITLLMALPTIRQQLTFGELLRNVESGTPFNLGDIMMKSGYSKASAKNPTKNLLKKEGWQQLLAQIDNQVILTKFYEILLSSDKRASLEAGDKLLKLKDLYPTPKLKLQSFQDNLDKLKGKEA